MSETRKVELTLRNFEQQQFVKWMRERVLRGEAPLEHLKEAASLPYKRAISKLGNYFREFVLQEVSREIKVPKWDVIHFEIGRNRFTSKANFVTEFAEQLERTLEQEHGASGMVPHRFVSAIISEIEEGVEEISSCLYRSSEYLKSTQRHGGRVTPQVVRAACMVCRHLESLTNLFVEINFYVSSKSLSERKISSKTSWSDRISFLRSFPSHKPIAELHELIVGSSYPLSIDETGLVEILDKIRDIRNKIAHPADVQIEDIEKLIELSQHAVRKVVHTCPLLARIAEVTVSSSGGVQLGLYLEVDHHREEPRIVFYEDLLNIGQNIDSSAVGKEVIVVPVVRLTEDEYVLEKDTPIVLLRKDDVVSALHGSLVVDIPVVVHYSEVQVEEEYIPEQEVEEIS